jgi:RNA polymerase sigma-54 factor
MELRQSQQLVMTPQLRQAIGMLQMSTLELTGYLAAQVEANPILVFSDRTHSVKAPATPSVPTISVDREMRSASLAAGEAQFVTGRENLYESGEALTRSRTASDGDAAEDRIARIAATPSLSAHVEAQLGLMRLAPAVRHTATLLAGDLDEDGYLRASDAQIAERLGTDDGMAADARAALQACEPTGIGARNLAECLGLQLAERNRLDPAMQALLSMLERLPTTPTAILARVCAVSPEDFAEMLAELRALDPRPGRRYLPGTATPAAPDVLVRPDGEGGWHVTLNPASTPRLLIDRSYAARVARPGCERTKLFLSECLQNAGWLRRSLDQRARTILRVAGEIVRVQGAFLEHGLDHLRPLTLRMVADAVDMHESTVSRVTANKLVATPRGTLPMKFFFTAAIAAADGGDAHAAQAVRGRIQALVAAEPPGKPLSDDGLVQLLRAEGIDVARRTVAKYREALRIPSSVERRRRAAAAV